MRKKRGYNREPEMNLVRDYKLFAIACEGGKREPDYFRVFRHISRRISVDIVDEIICDEEMDQVHSNKSAPKWVLDRAVRYIEKEGLSNDDDLWFVLDKDRWTLNQLKEVADYCEQYPNWHIIVSNPCFEVWLYFHKKGTKPTTGVNTCANFKHAISQFNRGGYHPLRYIPDLREAIKNAKANDTNPDFFMPNNKETKMYQLGEVLIEFIGISGFNKFLEEKLDLLIANEVDKQKAHKK